MITDIEYFRILEAFKSDLSEFVDKFEAMIAVYAERGVEITWQAGPHRSIILHKLVVPNTDRNTGIGTSFLTGLCGLADEYGVYISLSPADSYGGNVNRLRKFYKRFGFVNNVGRDNVGRKPDYRFLYAMLRVPKDKNISI